MRLDKYLTECGIASRKTARDTIKTGRVSVNGEILRDPGCQIQENQARVFLDGLELAYKKYRYYMLNKPKGVLTAVRDASRKSVMDILPFWVNKKNLKPVGRLDMDTEGLLLLTNDGKTAHALLSPKKHVKKTYRVVLKYEISGGDLRKLVEGVDIGDRLKTRPAEVKRICGDEILLTITEGRYHQVKRMMQAVGNEVAALTRISFAGLRIGDLPIGEVREIHRDDIFG